METASTVFASTELVSFETLSQEVRDLLARLGLGQTEIEKLLDPRTFIVTANWP